MRAMLTMMKPAAATEAALVCRSQRQTYSPSCSGSRKPCCAPQEGSEKYTLPSRLTTKSFGELNFRPCQLSSSGVASPDSTSSANSAPPVAFPPCKHHGAAVGC